MGRKIPGKKHKGVKDPEKQRRKRFNSLKGKINVPPSDPDIQEVPHSVNRIAELKQQLKNRKSSKKLKQEFPNAQHSNSRTQVQRKPKNKKKKEGRFKQLKGESDKNYLHRVNKACEAVIRETAFEIKYGVDIKRNPITGEVDKLVKRPKDEIEQLMKDARKTKKRKNAKKSTEPVLTKSQKRQKKLKEKKQKKLGLKESAPNQDVVKFGEVAHEPPTLSVPRKGAKLDGAPRPGERNLLLKSVLQNPKSNSDNKQVNKSENTLKKTGNKVIDKTGKRKNLPNALRRRLETQQAEIINAYRTLKKQRDQ